MNDLHVSDAVLTATQKLISAVESATNFSLSTTIAAEFLESEMVIRDIAGTVARQAFQHRNLVALDACHHILYRLLGSRIGLCNSTSDRSILPFAIEQILLNEFLTSEAKRTDILEAPSNPEAITSWWDSVLAPYTECPHPLFRFLEHEASPDQYRAFLLHDLGVHIPFDDVLASLMVGTRGEIRSEIFDNLCDELGTNTKNASHLTMVTELAEVLGLNIGLGSAIWQAKACANSLLAFCLYGSLFPEAVGYLGCLEVLTPARFRMLGLGGERLGISREHLRYYFEHTGMDDLHAHGWLHRVIVPLVQTDKEVMQRIRIGVGHRLSVSAEFWSTVLEQIRSL